MLRMTVKAGVAAIEPQQRTKNQLCVPAVLMNVESYRRRSATTRQRQRQAPPPAAPNAKKEIAATLIRTPLAKLTASSPMAQPSSTTTRLRVSPTSTPLCARPCAERRRTGRTMGSRSSSTAASGFPPPTRISCFARRSPSTDPWRRPPGVGRSHHVRACVGEGGGHSACRGDHVAIRAWRRVRAVPGLPGTSPGTTSCAPEPSDHGCPRMYAEPHAQPADARLIGAPGTEGRLGGAPSRRHRCTRTAPVNEARMLFNLFDDRTERRPPLPRLVLARPPRPTARSRPTGSSSSSSSTTSSTSSSSRRRRTSSRATSRSAGYVEFAIVFGVIWVAWANGTLYYELHGREDGRTRNVRLPPDGDPGAARRVHGQGGERRRQAFAGRPSRSSS